MRRWTAVVGACVVVAQQNGVQKMRRPLFGAIWGVLPASLFPVAAAPFSVWFALKNERLKRASGCQLLFAWRTALQRVHFAMRMAHRASQIAAAAVWLLFLWIVARLQPRCESRCVAAAVASLQRLGGACVKGAQWASSRSDVLPLAVCRALRVVHYAAASAEETAAFDAMAAQLRDACGDSFALDRDADVKWTILGSGSIATVLRGHVTGANRRPVAVKILRVAAVEKLLVDAALLRIVASFVDVCIPSWRWADVAGELRTFCASIAAQCDLRREAQNLRVFRRNFNAWRLRGIVAFPAVYAATREVLVEELVDSQTHVSLSALLSAKEDAERSPNSFVGGEEALRLVADRVGRRVAHSLLRIFAKMVLQNNFYHADLHPGNIFVDIRTGSLFIVDAGLAASLAPADWRNFVALFSAAVLRRDGAFAGALLITRSSGPLNAVRDAPAFCEGVRQICEEAMPLRALIHRRVSPAAAVTRLLALVQRHRVKLSAAYANILTSVACIDGAAERLAGGVSLLPLLRDAAEAYVSHAYLG